MADKALMPKRRPKNFEDIVSINVDKKSGNLTQKQKIQAAIKAGTLQVGDVNEMTPYDIEQLLKAKGKRFGGKVEKYGHGGSVKGGKMSCRGMGKANKGGGYSIR